MRTKNVRNELTLVQLRAAEVVAALQPGCEEMEREIKRKWRESEDMEHQTE